MAVDRTLQRDYTRANRVGSCYSYLLFWQPEQTGSMPMKRLLILLSSQLPILLRLLASLFRSPG
jgi:hypothetical protein